MKIVALWARPVRDGGQSGRMMIAREIRQVMSSCTRLIELEVSPITSKNSKEFVFQFIVNFLGSIASLKIPPLQCALFSPREVQRLLHFIPSDATCIYVDSIRLASCLSLIRTHAPNAQIVLDM